MDIGTETACTASKREASTSLELVNQLNEAKDELIFAVESADAERIISLRLEIERLPLLIHTAKITEAQTNISALDETIERQGENIRLIHEVLVAYNREYQAELERVRPFKERFENAGFKKRLAEEQLHFMRESRRDARRELEELVDELKCGTHRRENYG